MSLQYVLLPIILCIVAGFINGSYVTPSKWMKGWNDEIIWLSYTLFGFILISPRNFLSEALCGGALSYFTLLVY